MEWTLLNFFQLKYCLSFSPINGKLSCSKVLLYLYCVQSRIQMKGPKSFLTFLRITVLRLFAFVVGIFNIFNILGRLVFFLYFEVLALSSCHWYTVIRLNLVSLLWKISQIYSTQKVRSGNINDSFCFYFGTNRARPVNQTSNFIFFATLNAFTHLMDPAPAFFSFFNDRRLIKT